MKSPCCFLLLCLPFALSAAEVPPRLTAAERHAEIKARIEALFKLRTDPPPYAIDSPNPFRLPGDPPPGAETSPRLVEARTELDRPLTDPELLQRLATGLRIGGMVEMADAKPRIFVNQRNYREGDAIPITYRDQVVKLVVKSLTSERLLLGLNEAEFSIRLKKGR